MPLDIRQIAENMIASLWVESDKLRHQAEGVRLFLQEIIKEGERLNGQQAQNPGPATPEEKQAE